MEVKIAKIRTGFGMEKKEYYVSRVDRNSVYEIEDIARQVELESGVNKRQFLAAVDAMVDAIIVFLKGGHGVSLKNFGTFLPEVKSDSSTDPDQVGVKRVRVSFRPHKQMQEAVAGISYTTTNSFATSAPGSGSAGGDGGSDEGGTEMS